MNRKDEIRINICQRYRDIKSLHLIGKVSIATNHSVMVTEIL